MGKRKMTAWRLWAMPVLLAVVSTLGLVSALLGETVAWHWVSWLCLTVPLLVIIRCVNWPVK